MAATLDEILVAVEELSASWLGKFGIVSIGDAYEADGSPFILVLVNGDIAEVQEKLPRSFRGIAIQVGKSGEAISYR